MFDMPAADELTITSAIRARFQLVLQVATVRVAKPFPASILCAMPGLRSNSPVLPPAKNGGSVEQALSLLTGPLSKDLPARHIASIRHLCADLRQGCTFESLPNVQKILELVLQRVRASQSYAFEEVACDLLRSVAGISIA